MVIEHLLNQQANLLNYLIQKPRKTWASRLFQIEIFFKHKKSSDVKQWKDTASLGAAIDGNKGIKMGTLHKLL